jgi:hypothetical protein
MESKFLTNLSACVLIAGIYTIGASLKLWVGMANLQFLSRQIILDWQKQYKI